MVYDVTMLEAFYAAYKGKVEHVRAILKRPLTLAEKILYAHLYDVADLKDYKRGEDYVNFRPLSALHFLLRTQTLQTYGGLESTTHIVQ